MDELGRLQVSFEESTNTALEDAHSSHKEAKVTVWWRRIVDAYNEPQRHYHKLSHIVSMHEKLEELPNSLVADRQAVIYAITFHDIVYDPRATHGHNELESLKVWQTFAQEVELDQRLVDDVSVMIRATILHKLPDIPYPLDLPLFLDLDLEVLGRSRGQYLAYATGIRREYIHYSVEDYCKGRITVLERLKGGDIYFTEYFRGHYAQMARDNLAWEIDILGQASFVDFPGSLEDAAVIPPASPTTQRPLHLPFRRISMPTAPPPGVLAHIRAANPHLKDHRMSMASQHSLESQSENLNGQNTNAYNMSSPVSSSSPKPRRSMSRPSSLQPPPKAPAINPSTTAKKKKVLRELLETEKTYVDGLEFINEHFLAPLVTAAQEGKPLLSPGQMASIFSNFIDMLGFHQSFYESLNSLIGPAVKPVTQPPSAFPPPRNNSLVLQTSLDPLPSIAPLLAQHIPFLAMYTPFVTAYPTIMASIHNLTSQNSSSFSPQFASWLKEREHDPACGKFGLRDWLLTLVQRCPRYLLLIRELLNSTDPNEIDYTELEKIVKQLDHINVSLNTALQTQSITIQLLAIQKATPNLPIPFLEPGRTFIKRGSLFQMADRVERLREFFLFSDCLVWLSKGGEREGAVTVEESQFKRSMMTSPSVSSSITSDRRQSEAGATPLRRPSSTAFGSRLPSSPNVGEDERWWFRGKLDLLDLDIVLPVATFGEEGRIEVHSPAMSFSIYCDSADERETWASAIRAAKQSRLDAMNSTNPNSTLTASWSNQHLRLALQALPYAPDESSPATPQKKKSGKKDKSKQLPKRGHVEHFVPAIWVPDSKTDSCMRCGGVFGWRRRRHHCRLCGKCVCANCSSKTFFITSKEPSKESSKPARACNACYEAVFPVLEPESPGNNPPRQTSGALPHYSSIGTLTALPFSKSTPSLLLPQSGPVVQPPQLHYELPKPVKRESQGEMERPASGLDFLPITRPKMPGSRPSSEIRSSSYTVSTMGSVLLGGGDSTMDIPSTADSPISPNSPGSSMMAASRPRHKTTFSTPAVALHTTPVMARASMDADMKGVRYSMVLGNKSRVIGAEYGDEKENMRGNARKSLDAGLAVGRLTDLLTRK